MAQNVQASKRDSDSVRLSKMSTYHTPTSTQGWGHSFQSQRSVSRITSYKYVGRPAVVSSDLSVFRTSSSLLQFHQYISNRVNHRSLQS